MRKKKYVPSEVQVVLFAPDHALANNTNADNSAWWSFWNWGKYNNSGNASLTGTVNVWEDKKTPPTWIYNGTDANKPY